MLRIFGTSSKILVIHFFPPAFFLFPLPAPVFWLASLFLYLSGSFLVRPDFLVLEGRLSGVISLYSKYGTYLLVLLGPSPLSDSSSPMERLGSGFFGAFFLGLGLFGACVPLIDSAPISSSPLSLAWGFAAAFFAFCRAGAGSPTLAFLFPRLLRYFQNLSISSTQKDSIPGDRFLDASPDFPKIGMEGVVFLGCPRRL